MGRHTNNLSDWVHCGLCNQALEHGVCMCCGSGYTHICGICMKKKGNWESAIGDNKGCDKHLQKGDIKFPKEFQCYHVKCNDCGKSLDGRYCIRMIFEDEPLCDKCASKTAKKYLKPKPKLSKTPRLVIP